MPRASAFVFLLTQFQPQQLNKVFESVLGYSRNLPSSDSAGLTMSIVYSLQLIMDEFLPSQQITGEIPPLVLSWQLWQIPNGGLRNCALCYDNCGRYELRSINVQLKIIQGMPQIWYVIVWNFAVAVCQRDRMF